MIVRIYFNLHLLLHWRQKWNKKTKFLGGEELMAPFSLRGEGKDDDDDDVADQDCNFSFLVRAASIEH